MVEYLCTCDRYPEPHTHAGADWYDAEERPPRARSHVRRTDGTFADPDEVVRRVMWVEEAEYLGGVLYQLRRERQLRSEPPDPTIEAALARHARAIAEDGHAVPDEPVERGPHDRSEPVERGPHDRGEPELALPGDPPTVQGGGPDPGVSPYAPPAPVVTGEQVTYDAGR